MTHLVMRVLKVVVLGGILCRRYAGSLQTLTHMALTAMEKDSITMGISFMTWKN